MIGNGNQIGTSLIRTIVPMIVGWLIAQLAIRGLNIDPGLVEQLVTWGITSAYYVAVRVFETRIAPKLGWLLGLPKQPTYDAKAAASDQSPTGAVATEGTDGIPAGAPVEVVPADVDEQSASEWSDQASVGDGLGDAVTGVSDGVYGSDSKTDAARHGE